jgi:hypothetical protein
MKIGHVEETKIPADQHVQCQNGCLDEATKYRNGTPYCVECLHEEQRKQWEADGNFFVDGEGERVHFDVVSKLS